METGPLILTETAFDTPLGALLILVDPRYVIRAAEWTSEAHRLDRLLVRHYGLHGFNRQSGNLPPHINQALSAYFSGNLQAINTLHTATGGTPFQRQVWHALRNIPPGDTISYGALAHQLGHPRGARAIGMINGANPISIIVPCHRVIGANGNLTGYAGGLERKRWLLKHEKTFSPSA